MTVIGIVGFKGSGKGTIGDYLVSEHGFSEDSFANSLKDAVSSIFGWDRNLLEGHTKNSREWREQADEWWSNRLGYNVTPRSILQKFGTDVMRNNFHNDVWIYSLERRIKSNNVVITDCRFSNEIELIRKLNGKIWQVNKGPDPDWFNYKTYTFFPDFMKEQHPEVHESEWRWCQETPDAIVENNGTIIDLYKKIEGLMQ